MRLREAIAVATPAGRARRSRWPASRWRPRFALLAIVPLRSFREFAFVMAVGVLVDTFLVRTLLVPGADLAVRRARVVAGPARAPSVDARVPRPRRRAHRACRARARSAPPTRRSSRSPSASRRARRNVLAAQLPRDLRGLVLSPAGRHRALRRRRVRAPRGRARGRRRRRGRGAHARRAAHARRGGGGRPRLRARAALRRLRPAVRRALRRRPTSGRCRISP